jgi:hypothetical protein
MHSPGNIMHVANMVDPRIFEDSTSIQDVSPNIEFHI